MKIAVLGCGAIGGLFLGYLHSKGFDVAGVVKDYQKESFDRDGLCVDGVRGSYCYKVPTTTALEGKVDLAIFATKITDLKQIIEDNKECLDGAAALSTQNGIEADHILKEYFPASRIITSIVMFGATFYPPNKVVHNFEGDLILGNVFGSTPESFAAIEEVLKTAFKVERDPAIKGAKYLKVFINLNNCIPAVLGLSMQEAFSDLDTAKLAIELNREAYQVVSRSGIELSSLPAYPKERLLGLVAMDKEESAKILSKVMTSLSDKPLYGSILQSIKRGKKSEIDYINGHVLHLAQKNGLNAALNEKIVDLVHRVEETGRFLDRKELLKHYEVPKA